mgnify:CR=1 FL=1
MKQHYLVVEGCIGTEKTELAEKLAFFFDALFINCLLYTSPSPRD